jgi:MATE family multidrug resistance protein
MTSAAARSDLSETNRRLLALSGPIVLANLSVPLPGMVDTAVMGHLPEASGLAAVGLGALIFSTLYFTFGFLRMSTVALTAQAEGANDPREIRAWLYRSVAIALVLSSFMLAFQGGIGTGAFELMDAEPDVVEKGLVYFDIRIWGAPAALLNMAIMGWLFGLGEMRWPVGLQIVTNMVNVVLDLVFVLGFGWGIDGVAAATVIAEWTGTALGVAIVMRELARRGAIKPPWSEVIEPASLKRLFGVNRDIFIRTLCLLIAFAHFKIVGTAFGTETLAANLILLIFLDLTSYGLDAFANAAEIMVGKAVGARDRARFKLVSRLAHAWSAGTAVLAMLLLMAAGPWIFGLFTDQESVRQAAEPYIFWAALLPVTSFWAFVLDGIFIGATRTAALRNGMIAAIALYFGAQWFLTEAWGNHGLWLAVHIFLLARGITLGIQYPALVRSLANPR